MKRRTFLSSSAVISTAAIHSIVSGGSAHAAAASFSSEPTATTEQRYFYLKRLLRELCTDLGSRPSGSPSFDAGMRIIKREMDVCPVSEVDTYRFERWELEGPAEFTVGGKKLDCAPHHGCAGTPDDGITGVLKKPESGGWPYVVADKKTGAVLAYVSVSSYGPAIPSNASTRPERTKPIIGIGKYDSTTLEEAVRAGIDVRIRANVRFTPDTPSSNIVGTIPGRKTDEILFLAHADTVYTSPGANDNTASVIVMLMLARAFADTRPEYTLRFVATGNEEYGMLGAKHYGEKRMKEGTMQAIRYVVQFDSLTYGPNFLLTSQDKGLRNYVRAINDDLGTGGTPRDIDSDPWVMDAAPFKSSGARAIYINSRGYDGITLPVYHRPEDVPETVGFDCVENSFNVFSEFVRRIGTI